MRVNDFLTINELNVNMKNIWEHSEVTKSLICLWTFLSPAKIKSYTPFRT